MGALWRPLGLLQFLVCTTRVLQWGSKKLQKHLKINGLGRFFGTLLGRPIWTMRTKNTFPCSVAFILHFREAFPCSAALVFGFSTCPWVVQHGPVRASEISIKPMHFCIFWKRIEKGGCARSGCESTPMQRGVHTKHRKHYFYKVATRETLCLQGQFSRNIYFCKGSFEKSLIFKGHCWPNPDF